MSLLLETAVRAMLEASEDVTELVDDRIYPVVATEGVPAFPYVLYNAQITGCEYCKGEGGLGLVQDNCLVEVSCVSNSFDEAKEIQMAVRAALECQGVTEEAALGYIADPLRVENAGCIWNQELAAYEATIQLTTFTQPVPEEDGEVGS